MDTKKSSPSSKPSHKQVECTAIYLYTLFSFFFLLTFHSLTITNTSTTTTITITTFSDHPLTFHPLKDTKIPPYKHPNKTWFMSTLSGKAINGMPEHFVFPSDHQHSKNNNKILCISPRNKSYAFTTDHLPENTTVLPGLTFIADSFYDYENPWHGMNAVAGFFAWMKENECKKPSRFLLFKNGEVVKRVGSWVYNLMKVGLGEEVVLERLEGSSDRDIVCFEKVVMMRRGLGGMSGMMRHGLFEMLRSKAWRYCNGSRSRSSSSGNEMIKISLVGREGKKRGFKDENEVKHVMKRECDELDGCSFSFIRFTSNMSFCDQVCNS
ncbi:putative nitroreductase C-terminal bacterial protein [Dioscorea alata]|uniref:Nitroreductase C-terminal bacterial protein n=1 Tax=Dioscorea alata TaxID=55571 RepID=A0ACB7UFG2_DIOAL|nr:putative nitroreductase C-terminal bacterial protein [Dioscorea alata]